MKKTCIFSSFVALAFVLMLTTSCEKGERAMTSNLTGTWKVMKYNGNNMSTSIIKLFEKDGSYKATTTVLGKDIVYDGTWIWVNNTKVVRVTLVNDHEDFTVVSLTDREFSYRDDAGALWEMAKQ